MKVNKSSHVTRTGNVKKNPAKDDNRLRAELSNFIGTENYYNLSYLKQLKSTDGVAFLAEKAQAYWLIDVIESHYPKVRGKEFLIAELKVNADRSAEFTMQEDSNTAVLVRQKIPYTDFPLSQIKLYIRDGVLMLPSEY